MKRESECVLDEVQKRVGALHFPEWVSEILLNIGRDHQGRKCIMVHVVCTPSTQNLSDEAFRKTRLQIENAARPALKDWLVYVMSRTFEAQQSLDQKQGHNQGKKHGSKNRKHTR